MKIETGDCMIYAGPYNTSGSPIINTGSKQTTPVRVLYEHQYGELQNDYKLYRQCDGIGCINLDHFKLIKTSKEPDYRKRRKEMQKEKAVSYLGGRCASCGTTEQLEFDHIDRNEMNFRIIQWISSRWDKIEKELQLCQLLCSDCHKVKTAKEMKNRYGGIKHGTISGYSMRCRCDQCKKAHSIYQSEWQRNKRRQRNSTI